ncbi:hypothetical protein EYF80_062808 [Liparis tanakae]|uniref:Uncharacterized protein n=1 Tax=Liparis tanakae TaxID=230148 RepID=A0A4Z2EDW6_9TELE|nr:hypothetical protein EYF80_062808 [Liparis tanakae]
MAAADRGCSQTVRSLDLNSQDDGVCINRSPKGSDLLHPVTSRSPSRRPPDISEESQFSSSAYRLCKVTYVVIQSNVCEQQKAQK